MSNLYELLNDVEMTRGSILDMAMTDAIVCDCEIRLGAYVKTIHYRTFFDDYDTFTSYDVLLQAFMDRGSYLDNRYKESEEERLRNLTNSLENLFGEDIDLVAEYFVKELDPSTIASLENTIEGRDVRWLITKNLVM